MQRSRDRVERFTYQVVNTFPHDSGAYCQGLAYDDGVLFEGTGHYGESAVRRVELETGVVLKQQPLSRRYFGEGIAIWGNRLIQLTWKGRRGFVYDKESLEPVEPPQRSSFTYSGQGWGLTHDGRHLIMSDGTSTLRFLDPETYRVVRRITVRMSGRRIVNLNELEFVEGQIFANVWQRNYLLRISPQDGTVNGLVDLSGILPGFPDRERDRVLNGIAYDARSGRLFVTGKYWPKLFEIRLIAQA